MLAGVDPAALIAIGRDVSQRRLLDEQQRRADFQTLQFQAALLELARTESSCLAGFSCSCHRLSSGHAGCGSRECLGLQRHSY